MNGLIQHIPLLERDVCLLSILWKGSTIFGLTWWLSGKESICQCRRLGFNPWVGKIPWRRKWQPTPNSCLGNPMDGGTWWGHKRIRYDLATKTNNSTIFINKGLLWYEKENLNEQECYFSNSRTFFSWPEMDQGINIASTPLQSDRSLPCGGALAQMFHESLSSFIRQISLMSYSFIQWMIIKPVQVLHYLDDKQSCLRRGHNIVGNYRRHRFDP